jgi:hypothetical protein
MDGGTQTAIRPGNEAHWPLSVQAPPGRTVPGRGWASDPGDEVSVRLAAASGGGGPTASGCRIGASANPAGTPASVGRDTGASGCRALTGASANPAGTPASVSRDTGASGCRGLTGASASTGGRPASVSRDTGASGCPGGTVPASGPGLESTAASPMGRPPASMAALLSRPAFCRGARSGLGPSTRAASPPASGGPAGADRETSGSRSQPTTARPKTRMVFAARIMSPPEQAGLL